jgi:glycosyltransferase involved in cell wall biosynthesis
MKIVIASGIYPPDIGGPATYSRLIAGEFIKRNIDVSIVCYSDKKNEEMDRNDNFKIVRVARKNSALFRYFVYFWNLFRLAKNCDIVYAQGPLGAGLPALVVAKILRKKFIIKIVGDYAWEQGVNQFGIKDLIEEFQKKKYDSRTERIRKIQKLVVRKADRIITPSEFLKKIVKGWGAKEEKIIVVYNAGPEIGKIAGTAPKTGLEGDILVSAARLEPWKGMVALIEIMPELLQKNPNFRLFIVGDGPLTKDLKSKIQNLNLEDKVVLAGRVPHDELMSYFKISMIFVLNTGYEGLPHIALEAMACGLPVVTTNVCGNPEVVRNNYNGILVEYNDKEQLKNAIMKIWENRNLREEFIENGKEALKKFTREEMINNTIKVLSESTN